MRSPTLTLAGRPPLAVTGTFEFGDQRHFFELNYSAKNLTDEGGGGSVVDKAARAIRSNEFDPLLSQQAKTSLSDNHIASEPVGCFDDDRSNVVACNPFESRRKAGSAVDSITTGNGRVIEPIDDCDPSALGKALNGLPLWLFAVLVGADASLRRKFVNNLSPPSFLSSFLPCVMDLSAPYPLPFIEIK